MGPSPSASAAVNKLFALVAGRCPLPRHLTRQVGQRRTAQAGFVMFFIQPVVGNMGVWHGHLRCSW